MLRWLCRNKYLSGNVLKWFYKNTYCSGNVLRWFYSNNYGYVNVLRGFYRNKYCSENVLKWFYKNTYCSGNVLRWFYSNNYGYGKVLRWFYRNKYRLGNTSVSLIHIGIISGPENIYTVDSRRNRFGSESLSKCYNSYRNKEVSAVLSGGRFVSIFQYKSGATSSSVKGIICILYDICCGPR